MQVGSLVNIARSTLSPGSPIRVAVRFGKCQPGGELGFRVRYRLDEPSVPPRVLRLGDSMLSTPLAKLIATRSVWTGVITTSPVVLPCQRIGVNDLIPIEIE